MSVQYSIGELAKLANVSPRTLRHYEQLGLLVPKRANNNYRYYDEACAKRLSYIVVMRSCGMPLQKIKDLLTGNMSISDALDAHLYNLCDKQAQLDMEIARTEKIIEHLERIKDMQSKEAFEELKRASVEEFEKNYGKEAREKYGSDVIDEANSRMLQMTDADWNAKEELEKRILEQLRIAYAADSPTSDEAHKLVQMHHKWVGIHWGCDPEWNTYCSLVEGYLGDARFVAYYDEPCGDGATKFLVDAVEAYIE